MLSVLAATVLARTVHPFLGWARSRSRRPLAAKRISGRPYAPPPWSTGPRGRTTTTMAALPLLLPVTLPASFFSSAAPSCSSVQRLCVFFTIRQCGFDVEWFSCTNLTTHGVRARLTQTLALTARLNYHTDLLLTD
uniref:Putative secreted protein n=1 Tax=Anopheles aquasalis TaxID=42839 RepID=T1DFR9_ANOAQ